MTAFIIKDAHDSKSNQLLYTGFDPNPAFIGSLENQKIHHVFFEGASFDKKIGQVNTYNLEYRNDQGKAYKAMTGLLALKYFKGQEPYSEIKESLVADLKDHYQTELPADLEPDAEIEFIYNLLGSKIPKELFEEFKTDWTGDIEAALGKYMQKRDEEMTKAANEVMRKHPGESFVVVIGGMHEQAFRDKIQSVALKVIDAQAVYDESPAADQFYSRMFSQI